LLNQSGVSGTRLNQTQGLSPGTSDALTLINNQCTTGGKITVRIDDGISTLNPSSLLQMNLNNTSGAMRADLGDGMLLAQSNGNICGGQSVAEGNGFVKLQGDGNQVLGNQSFLAGIDSPSATVFPSIDVSNNNVGTGAIGGNQTVSTLGNINSHQLSLPVGINSNTVHGNQAISAGNNSSVFMDPTIDTGRLDITMGDGGINHLESLTLLGVDSGDPNILFNSKAGDTVTINFMNVMINDPHALFYMRDYGRGKDIVNFDTFTEAGVFNVYLSNSGHNDLTAHNVKVKTGFIFGGGGMSKYHDNGGNSGYIVFGFS
jgi:hypothetical protein